MDRKNTTDLSLVNAKTEVSAWGRSLLNKADYYHMGIIPLFFPGCAFGCLFRSYMRQGSESRLVGHSGPAYVAVVPFNTPTHYASTTSWQRPILAVNLSNFTLERPLVSMSATCSPVEIYSGTNSPSSIFSLIKWYHVTRSVTLELWPTCPHCCRLWDLFFYIFFLFVTILAE